MANIYDVGDRVRCSGVFVDASSDAFDPTTVKFKFTDPSDNTTTHIYNTDAALVKDSTGNYHDNVPTDEGGTWWWRWEGYDSNEVLQCADEGYFEVAPSQF